MAPYSPVSLGRVLANFESAARDQTRPWVVILVRPGVSEEEKQLVW